MKKAVGLIISKSNQDDKHTIEDEIMKTGKRRKNYNDKRKTVLTTKEYSSLFESDWFYTDQNDEYHGPVSWQVFKTMYKVGKIRVRYFVRLKAEDDWKVVGGPFTDLAKLSLLMTHHRKFKRALLESIGADVKKK